MEARAAAHLAALARVLDSADVSLYLAGGLAEPLTPLLADRLGREVARPAADTLTGCSLVAAGSAPDESATPTRRHAQHG